MRQKPQVYELFNQLASTVYDYEDGSITLVQMHLDSTLLLYFKITDCSLFAQAAHVNLNKNRATIDFDPRKFLDEASKLYKALEKYYKWSKNQMVA